MQIYFLSFLQKNFENQNVVKVITKENIEKNKFSSAKNFFRTMENKKSENVFHHIGIYIYKVSILEKFISLKQSPGI